MMLQFDLIHLHERHVLHHLDPPGRECAINTDRFPYEIGLLYMYQ